ncbi:hypothetical protein RFI_06306 [Reticulomyxa filosa]|uniref:Uncharacterized protein n=1 Tax=Reticulomyxa filosa TaxID=46433 RepID=X6NYA0_RETFI|nr:hypothetical protein RFI_06306 [Reticulomyxa filosa]|eukprot:ETO30809.1 hypothetical protein RFI_06306 [Reticulomyxa filosa]
MFEKQNLLNAQQNDKRLSIIQDYIIQIKNKNKKFHKDKINYFHSHALAQHQGTQRMTAIIQESCKIVRWKNIGELQHFSSTAPFVTIAVDRDLDFTNGDYWDSFLPSIVTSCNITSNKMTMISPHELVYDNFEIGDSVLLFVDQRVGNKAKLMQNLGPYAVIQRTSPVNLKIKNDKGFEKIMHVSKLKKLNSNSSKKNIIGITGQNFTFITVGCKKKLNA